MSAAEAPRLSVPSDFWDHWGDGKGELNGYSLTQPRYGTPRSGTSVMIFVTEPFLDGPKVKDDGGKGDYQVMKLNWIKDFQTGIYDYNTMTSIFMPLKAFGGRPLGTPGKITFSSQEWCGSLFSTLEFGAKGVERRLLSYFEGESVEDTLPLPEGGISQDTFPILARGLLGELVEVGETRSVQVLPALFDTRMEHSRLAWADGTIQREAATPFNTPAGAFSAETWILQSQGESMTVRVEASAPHRIVGWSTSKGEEAKLLGSERLPYWRLHKEGDEAMLRVLGLGDKGGAPGSTPENSD